MKCRRLSSLMLALILILAGVLPARATASKEPPIDAAEQPVIVELKSPIPSVIAAYRAHRTGRSFDRSAYEATVTRRQDEFLEALRVKHIQFEIRNLAFNLATGPRMQEARFASLINAVALQVGTTDIGRIRAMPEVKQVTIDRPMKLLLDQSVPYIRASDGAGNKTIFTQGGGPPQRFDGTGQVVAVIDTGIDSSHPMFDTRFSDADYLMRTGDTRPVRQAGEPYEEGTHHPKVVYFMDRTDGGSGDTVGHGTHSAGDAAGLKVRAPGDDGDLGTGDDRDIEGVAPGALILDYKACSEACEGVDTIASMEDAVKTTDPEGNPKPVADAINMSFGSITGGDPDDPTAVAAANAAFAGAVPVASAGNSGGGVESDPACGVNATDCENSVGSPAVGRGVIATAATTDPADEPVGELDVLTQDGPRYTTAGESTGAQDDTGRPSAPEDKEMLAFPMAEAPLPTFPLGQHYVDVGQANTPLEVPASVSGRIALALRGNTTFGLKAQNAASRGAVAILIYNNVDGELTNTTAAGATIPAFGVSKANGEYLRNTLGFDGGGISNFPLRIDEPAFILTTTGFSSRGPAEDFSVLKPDITAPGNSIYSSSAGGLDADGDRYADLGGTSFSGPQVAGSAALVRQALLTERGAALIDPAALRSGAGAAQQQAQSLDAPVSRVRAALLNTATNFRETDGETPIPDGNARSFLHEIGSGLVHVAQAAGARAVLGTNELNANRLAGPDDSADPDFLSTYSFGENSVVDSGIQVIKESITVTLDNISGATGAGTYTLSLVEGGEPEGDVTKPIAGSTGFSVGLDAASVSLGSGVGDNATFVVSTTVDGRPAPDGLALAGTDDLGNEAVEFLWWIVASGDNGEVLRMPFYYRAVQGSPHLPPPEQDPIEDDPSPDQTDGVDRDGNFKLKWDFPMPPEFQPCQFRIEETTDLSFETFFTDDAGEPLVAGENSKWQGDPQWVTGPHPETSSQGYTFTYTDELDISLTLKDPVVIPSGKQTQLAFNSFEDIEEGFDFAYVEASADGGGFQRLATFTGFFDGTRAVDLTQFAGQSVIIRFRFTSDQLVSAPLFLGWFIDDIVVQSAGNLIEIAVVDGSTYEYLLTGKAEGTYFYSIRGLFFDCPSNPTTGQASNFQQITVDLTGLPTAVARAEPMLATTAQPVTFDGSASFDDTDPPEKLTYEWDFESDGTYDAGGQIVSHTYAAPGTYSATLRVTDTEGLSDNDTVSVRVSCPSGDLAYWEGWDIARDIVILPGTRCAGYVLDGWGAIFPFGGAPEIKASAYWPRWDIARSIDLNPDGKGGYVLDAWGSLHPFAMGDNPIPSSVADTPYWPGSDLAKDFLQVGNGSGYILDGYGGVHAFGGAVPAIGGPYWPGWDIARAITPNPDGGGGYVLDGYGGVHAFGGAAAVGGSPYFGFDIARDLAFLAPGKGVVLDGYGGIHPFGGASPVVEGVYFSGLDIANALALSQAADGLVLDGWGGRHRFSLAGS